MDEDSLSADQVSQEVEIPKKRTLNSLFAELKKPVVAQPEDLLLEAEEQEALGVELSQDEEDNNGGGENSDMGEDSDDLNAADMKDV